jgi:hypothetical protein
MEQEQDAVKIVTHEDPIWRDRANFIIQGIVEQEGPQTMREQLWARQVEDLRFEICCIPFFLYNIALGDQVITGDFGNKKYVIESRVQRSGRYVFRVWLKSLTTKEELRNALSDMGCLLEDRGPSSRLLAVDAADRELSQRVADFLQEQEDSGEINYETGLLETDDLE